MLRAPDVENVLQPNNSPNVSPTYITLHHQGLEVQGQSVWTDLGMGEAVPRVLGPMYSMYQLLILTLQTQSSMS